MEYKNIKNGRYELSFLDLKPKDVLLAIAEVSYETAVPRGLDNAQNFKTLSSDINFDDFIKYERHVPVMLLMSYVEGRDCRTKVFKNNEGKWYLDSHAFEQRKVTSIESIEGLVKDSANKFLDAVKEKLNYNN